jgi:hypothetical protein
MLCIREKKCSHLSEKCMQAHKWQQNKVLAKSKHLFFFVAVIPFYLECVLKSKHEYQMSLKHVLTEQVSMSRRLCYSKLD